MTNVEVRYNPLEIIFTAINNELTLDELYSALASEGNFMEWSIYQQFIGLILIKIKYANELRKLSEVKNAKRTNTRRTRRI